MEASQALRCTTQQSVAGGISRSRTIAHRQNQKAPCLYTLGKQPQYKVSPRILFPYIFHTLCSLLCFFLIFFSKKKKNSPSDSFSSNLSKKYAHTHVTFFSLRSQSTWSKRQGEAPPCESLRCLRSPPRP